MYAALAVIVLAMAACSLCVARGWGAARAPSDQVRGFLYVGGVALIGLALTVLGVGLAGDRSARAESLAVLGLFTYALYLLVACAVAWLSGRER